MKRLTLRSKYTIFFLPFTVLSLIVLYTVELSTPHIILCLLILLILYTISIIFLTYEIIKPLRETYSMSREISIPHKEYIHEEDFSVKISELNRIADKLNGMVNQKFLSSEIKDVHLSLLSVNERLISELETAKIFKVNRNEFFGNVAHELRTPIFAIQLSLETLIDGAINDSNVNLDFLQRATKQSERLKDLVNDLMTISKYESGVKLSKRYFSLSEHVTGIINELKGIADNKNITISFQNNLKNGTQVFGDSESIKQVFINLIENSTKYTPEGGNIIIHANESEKEVTIVIEDNGIGIPEKDIPRIFERFYRVDKNRSRDRGGTGLGLSIVKHILEVHESKFKVESEIDKGTKFTFTLKK